MAAVLAASALALASWIFSIRGEAVPGAGSPESPWPQPVCRESPNKHAATMEYLRDSAADDFMVRSGLLLCRRHHLDPRESR